MAERSDFARLADFLPEPLLLVAASSRVEFANRAARSLFGDDIAGATLAERLAEPDEGLRRYLSRCSGARSPMIGAATVRVAGGEPRKLHLEGALFAPAGEGGAARIVLRCRPRGVEEFSILGRKISELNGEIRQRRRIQAELEESLAQKDTLLRELQHRTKNYTQMLLGMFSAGAARTVSPEARALAETALSRLRAIGAAQQLMYEVERLDTVPARELVPGTCAAIAETWPRDIDVCVSAVEAALPNDVAVPLSLILNELLSNALKHGLKYGAGRVAVDLDRDGPDLALSVWDSGGGMSGSGPEHRSSGLAIVRGLCRQIGGVFETTGGDGFRAAVRFPDPELREERH